MSLQLRYCEDCGKAWPVAETSRCPSCGEERPCRDAVTVIHNLHTQIESYREEIK